MKASSKKHLSLIRRHRRVRRKVFGTPERPRLVVFRSLAHTYAQVVDDTTGRTLAAVSTLQKSVRDGLKGTGNVEAARAVGREIARAARERGIERVCFDRGGRRYHGRVKAVADAAREAGLRF